MTVRYSVLCHTTFLFPVILKIKFCSQHNHSLCSLQDRKCNFIYINARQWLRWSRGSELAFSTQVRRSRSRRIFKGEKILSTPSFGGEVKPSVPCRRFAACKRSLNGVEVVISAKLPDNILAHSSTFRR